MSDRDLVRRLRNLVALNEVEHGGPYRGTAATLCVETMAEAADEIDRLRRTLHPRDHRHFCPTCSPGDRPGLGCVNCRQTGMDQTPCIDCPGMADDRR